MEKHDTEVRDLDLSGLKCPLPVLRTRKVLERLPAGSRLRVICTDPLTVIDIPHLINETGNVLDDHQELHGKQVFLIRRNPFQTQKSPA